MCLSDMWAHCDLYDDAVCRTDVFCVCVIWQVITNGLRSQPGQFNYMPPMVDGTDPHEFHDSYLHPLVNVYGKGFVQGSTIIVGGLQCTNPTYIDDGHVRT